MKALMFRNVSLMFGLMLVVASMTGTALAGDPHVLPPSVPELDPGSMASALTVVSGALFILRGRRAGN